MGCDWAPSPGPLPFSVKIRAMKNFQPQSPDLQIVPNNQADYAPNSPNSTPWRTIHQLVPIAMADYAPNSPNNHRGLCGEVTVFYTDHRKEFGMNSTTKSQKIFNQKTKFFQIDWKFLAF